MAGLKTPRAKDMDLGESKRQQVKSAWDTSEDVLKRLSAQGFGLSQQPEEGMPTLSGEMLNTATHEEYLHLNALFLSWLDYAAPKLAHVRGTLLQVKNWKTDIEVRNKDRIRKAEKSLPKKDQTTKDELETIIWLDATYQRLTQLEQSITHEKLLLESKIDIIERTLRVVSRHVEVKRIELEQNRIEGNMPRRRPGLRSPNHGQPKI